MLKHLIEKKKHSARSVTTTPKQIGTFNYRFRGDVKKHLPDIAVKSKGSIQYYEVKSMYTLGCGDRQIFAKVRAKARSMWENNLDYTVVLCSHNRVLGMARNRRELENLVR